MPWARIDDTFYDHPKVVAVPLAAVGLHVKALSWCNRYLTDGLVPAAAVKRLGGTRRLADELVEQGLWERVGTAYAIHDFLAFSKSKEQVEEDRAAAAGRQRRAREAAAQSRRDNGVSSVPPSRPVPSRRDSRSTKETERVGDVLQRLVKVVQP